MERFANLECATHPFVSARQLGGLVEYEKGVGSGGEEICSDDGVDNDHDEKCYD